MEELFKTYAGYIALGLEVVAAIVIAIGAVEAIYGLIVRRKVDPRKPLADKKEVWVRLGVWLLLGLEFELGADIVRSAISPSWEQLGQLGAIALIRTFLNYFLEKDIEKYAESFEPSVAQEPAPGPV
jgi:uncharacterized membrane protein